jgi:predicted Zn-dependent protease
MTAERPCRTRARSTSAVVLLVLLATGAARADVGSFFGNLFSGLNLMSVRQEQEAAVTFAREIESKQRMLRDPVVQRFVDDVGRRLVAGIRRPEFRYRFRVVADRAVNAFNVGGGFIYVHAGLIEAAGTEAQLAATMAHEIGHQVERHVAKAISREAVFRTLARAAVGDRASQWVQLAAGLGITTGQLHFGREAERAADRVMVELMLRARYDPRESLVLFQRIRAIEGREPGRVTSLFSSHPPTSERIAAVRADLARRRLPGRLERDSRRFQDVQLRLRQR